MDEITRNKLEERILKLLDPLDLPEEKKEHIRNNILSYDIDRLEKLLDKLELIHSWEIKQDIDERIYMLEENFDNWIKDIKKGIVDNKTSENLKQESDKIKQVLQNINKIT